MRVAKVISKASDDSGHIIKEASLIKNLKHPHIPIIYDIYEDDISICIIEEYISGKSLRNYVLDEKPVKLNQICDIGIKLCNILEYLHNYQEGIIHLDIKPDNIMIDKNNDVKLIDFGNALYGSSMQHTGRISPGYAAPEQYKDKKLTYRADIYSVGMVLMFMADAKGQYSKDYMCNNIKAGDLNRIRHNRLYPIIRKCTRHNPEQRYSNIKTLRYELEKLNHRLEKNKCKSSNNHSYVIKFQGTKRGIGVTHIVLCMAYLMADYGIKCLVTENTDNKDILKEMLNGRMDSDGLLCYQGVWYAAACPVEYDKDFKTDVIMHKTMHKTSPDSFKLLLIDDGIGDGYKGDGHKGDGYKADDNIISSFIGYDYEIINVIVAGGRYGIDSECSIINNAGYDTRLILNLVDKCQFYGYTNYIAPNKSCYRMPCVFNWHERNEELMRELGNIIQDNMPDIWEYIITKNKKDRYCLLYEKMHFILYKSFKYLRKRS